MNRKLLFISVLLGMSGIASAQPYNRYMTFQAALADVDGYDSGIAGIATYGIRVPEMHKNFAVETELAMTFVEPEGKGRGGEQFEVSYYNVGAYGVYAHPLSQKFHVRGRLGFNYQDVEVSSPSGSKSDDDFELSYGFGITVGLGSESRFILEYTVIDSDINHISAGMQFKM
ncbi:MAG: porin family protein [Gammaproteobacteria bacterium]|nr:porin family protein [Gammaproteobacteria bacterium]